MKERILIAEDNPDMREMVAELLEDAGFHILTAANGREAQLQIARTNEMIDLVITDVMMPEMMGDDLLSLVRQCRPEAPVIVITAFGSVQQAVEMVKAGAFQYLVKPFKNDDLLQAVEDALSKSAPQRERVRLRLKTPSAPARIIGASAPMQKLFEMIGLAAESMSTVLIIGESGTGKELVARATHELSGRKGPFVPVNCAAIPSDLIESELFGHMGGSFTGARSPRIGMFEAADKGTLFLDEIGELPLPMQPKLLRALQEGTVRRVGSNAEKAVDVRLIAATNRKLEEDIQAGRFREDLYWRLNVIRLPVPSLRERPFDIPLLVEHFIAKGAAAGKAPLTMSQAALAVLTAYLWPGNVRELENAIERAAAFARGGVITVEDLPERVRTKGSESALLTRASVQNLTLREMERDYILEILRRTEGNKKQAAEILNLDRKTLYRKLDEYRAEGIVVEI